MKLRIEISIDDVCVYKSGEEPKAYPMPADLSRVKNVKVEKPTPPPAEVPAEDPKPAVQRRPDIIPRGQPKPCCGSLASRHKAGCGGGAPKPEESEDPEEEPEPEDEDAEELAFKCINPTCDDYDKEFQSKNRIPKVMCHGCGERQVVQVV